MSKITKSAHGEQCTVLFYWIPYHNSETVVFAHANGLKYGKGIGKKADDEHGAYACYLCHMTYDGHINRPKDVSKEYVNQIFEKAMGITKRKLIEKGLLNGA
ncbi:Protein of unknown function DUF1364 [uncultured Caudovirales phage]|uniref:Uncharacterized protein n=1 Tax=uncultured Caudovirales phage TaxID=2100421 RepID=A0A6J7WFH3_9CAUD|nr:Protein of unknown function DUF1364 [uncultured Caudovirales phage]